MSERRQKKKKRRLALQRWREERLWMAAVAKTLIVYKGPHFWLERVRWWNEGDSDNISGPVGHKA